MRIFFAGARYRRSGDGRIGRNRSNAKDETKFTNSKDDVRINTKANPSAQLDVLSILLITDSTIRHFVVDG